MSWLVAELWRDARWVTLLATNHISENETTVQRWTETARDRLPYECSVALKRYCDLMGAVDEFNKQLAATNMQMGRCKQRFQRSLFLGWLLPAIGVVNTRIAFCELLKEAWGDDALKALKDATGNLASGSNHFFLHTHGLIRMSVLCDGNGRCQEQGL